jgi:hypothetical protein
MKRDWYRRTHHLEQYAYASRVVKSLERAHEVSERPGQDSDRLPRPQTGLEERQIGFIHSLDEGFHCPVRNGDRALVAAK